MMDSVRFEFFNVSWLKRSLAIWILPFVLIAGCDSQNATRPAAPASGQIPSPDPRTNVPERKASSFRAMKLLEGSKFDEAWDECQKVLLVAPQDSRALYVAATVLNQRKKLDQALQLVDRIAIHDPEFGQVSHRDGVQWCYSSGRLRDAETRAKQLVSTYPRDIETIKNLAALLDLQGRRYESSLWMQRLVALGRTDINTLVLAVDTVKPVNSDAVVEKLMQSYPDSQRLSSSYAFGALFEKRPEDAERLFRNLITEREPAESSYLGLGLSLIDQEKYDQIPAWFASVPRPEIESHPAFWRILGVWYQRSELFPDAVYCFTRSVELDPLDYLAIGPLAQSLLANGQVKEAAEAEALFQRMQLTNRNMNYSRDGFRRPEWLHQIADTLQFVGRDLEAIAWRELCEQANDGKQETIASLQAKRRELSNASFLPSVRSPLSWSTPRLDKPDFEQFAAIFSSEKKDGANATQRTSMSAPMPAVLRWVDVAKELGAEFQYRNGDDPSVVGMQTYQSNGAGAGAIDFDRDGWPDLYVLQGGGDPRTPDSNSPGALFRNLSGARMLNVAELAFVSNRAYGQGVAVGDWDQDGFQDMFILNFGQNRLLKNMGDGTFSEVLIPDMRRDVANAPVWSVSGAIADLNGDHLPDLIEVNYSSGIDVITHQCFNQKKIPQVCRPTEFPASKDYIYLNDGEGGFRIANSEWGMELDEGRGLGIIVGNIDMQSGNDVYIANDMSPNNFLVSHSDPNHAGRFLLSDEAVRRGCAVDIQGKPQASMGVGCADIDRNGTLDLFMTNFIDEYNALYTQSASHFFQDASRRYRLIDPKKKTLGFGTQLLDLDCDGWQDIFIVNGHVDDYRSLGQPFEMRPQVFLQRDAAFNEQDTASFGEYFQRESLARSLGAWDFDRDGRPDWYVTHLDKPLSILQNRSKCDGSWIMLELVGVDSERDAVGAQVTVACGSEKWIHQRLAGNGFECSNEPWIYLGLGLAKNVDTIAIEWPSGTHSLLRDLQVNRRYRIVESIAEPVEDALVRSEP